jgi:hypothetical protein
MQVSCWDLWISGVNIWRHSRHSKPIGVEQAIPYKKRVKIFRTIGRNEFSYSSLLLSSPLFYWPKIGWGPYVAILVDSDHGLAGKHVARRTCCIINVTHLSYSVCRIDQDIFQEGGPKLKSDQLTIDDHR